MSMHEPIRLTLTEIDRYGQSVFAGAKKKTLLCVVESEVREAALDRLSDAVAGQSIVIERSDPAVMMGDDRKREFIQGVFSRDARGAGNAHLFVTSDPDFLHRINAIPAIERSAFFDLRTHMA